MFFEWDELKNLKNYRKHSVWFEEAKTVWADDYALEFFDEDHSESEDRYIRIGRSKKRRNLLVVFCERTANSIRIVSARLLTNSEREQYEEVILFKEIKEASGAGHS